MRSIGATEIIVIAIIIVFLFGGKKFPELTKGIRESIQEFKKGSSEKEDKPKEEKEGLKNES